MAIDAPSSPKPASPFTRTNPFPGKLTVNRSLCGEGSEKDTRHFEIDLTGWGLNYEVGDSMTIWPTNDPALVDQILKAICASGDEKVRVRKAKRRCGKLCSATAASPRPHRNSSR